MDERLKETAKQVLRAWSQERLQTLQGNLLKAFQEGANRLLPDDTFVERLLELGQAPAAAAGDRDLCASLDLLESSGSQGEVLRRLPQALLPFAERCAVFAVKQGIATLYVQRGFEADHPKPGAPVVPPPALEALIEGRGLGPEGSGPAYRALLDVLSRFEAADGRVLPLFLRRKCVALVLADSGLRQQLDRPGPIRALVHTAEACLSLLAGQREEERATAVTSPALHPSAPTMQLQDPIPETPTEPLDPKLRANAERSARVLVGDIELYFPTKVAEGRQQRRLYQLLQGEFDRSYTSFVERYGAELEARHHVFYQAILDQLCEGDPAVLGPVPWGKR